MRTRNSIKNIYISIVTQIVIVLLGFISRKIFLDSLGIEYLGINGLLTNVISMLGLVEGGIGTSIVYNLYKPLADHDKPRILALVQLYKRIYGILAIIIFVLSLGLYPFLGYLMKDGGQIPNLKLVYFIFIFKNIISYLNAHKWSLINADQKGYVLAKYNLLFNILTTVGKIIILYTTKNYIIFLIIELLIFIIQNLWNGKIVNDKYPYIKTKEKYEVDNGTKKNLIDNVKALFLHTIGGYCVFSTDNLLISTLVSIKVVGLYSNYTMILSQLGALINPILNGIGASVGNLIATESKEKNYDIFNVIYLINFWIYGFSTIFLYIILNKFINWWLGEGLLLDNITFIVILINFYITGMRSCISTFKIKAGIFTQDKYVPLIEAVINLGSSIILVEYFGLAGIFIGTTISTITMPFLIQPRLVYKNVFNKGVGEYYKKYIKYLAIMILAGMGTSYICNIVHLENKLLSLIMEGSLSVISINGIFILCLYRSKEFCYLSEVSKSIINQTLKKFYGKLNRDITL